MGEGPDESVKNYVRILLDIALNLEIAFGGVLGFLLWDRDAMTMATLIKENISQGLAYSSEG